MLLPASLVDFQKVNGNLGSNAGRGSAVLQVRCLSAIKSFTMPKYENIKLELRFDAFNVFNHTNCNLVQHE